MNNLMPSPRELARSKMQSHLRFELGSLVPFPTTITVTLYWPPWHLAVVNIRKIYGGQIYWFGLILWHINHYRLFNDLFNPFLYVWTVLFQTIQFSIITLFSSIWPIDRTISGAITLSQSGIRSDGNNGVFRIPQSSSISGASPLDWLVSYPGHFVEGVLLLSRDGVDVFWSPSQQGPEISFIWSQ